MHYKSGISKEMIELSFFSVSMKKHDFFMPVLCMTSSVFGIWHLFSKCSPELGCVLYMGK